MSVDADLRPLNARHQGAWTSEVNHQIFEAHGEDLAGDTLDAGDECIGVRASLTRRPQQEIRSEERPNAWAVPTTDSVGESDGGFRDPGMLIHEDTDS